MDAEESIAMVSKPNKECLQEFKDFINIYKKKSSEKSSAYISKNCNFHDFSQNGMQPKDDEMKWNHKKRAKDRFLLFCETVLNHERELLSEVRKKFHF